ncbi:MAG: hypothetical protein ABI620_00650 [Chloroflexota bacterium]
MPAFRASNTDIWRSAFFPSNFDVWIEKIYGATYVSGTNNGSNNWTVALLKNDTAFGQTSMGSFNTSADTASVLTPHSAAVNAALGAATNPSVSILVTKTSGPASVLMMCQVSYRLNLT